MGRDDLNERTVIERLDPLLGAVFADRYRVEFRLAAGGFGAIYRARDLASGRELALKVMHARLAADPGIVARFRREGATLATLRCPNTIAAYELGEAPDGTLYIVMELLHGVSLFERYRTGGRLHWRKMTAIARAVCSSLAEAHALGIVHRDLKPTNIHLEPMPDGEDFVKVLDFGIAKILQSSSFDSQDLTTAGQMIGTLDYMSPEQMVGGECTGVSDLHTLGNVMYEMIAGRRPFGEALSAAQALAAILTPPPSLSSIVIVPQELDRIIARCLERDPADRFQSADELAAALDHVFGQVAADDAATTRELAPIGDDATQVQATPPPVFRPQTMMLVPPPPTQAPPRRVVRPTPPPPMGGYEPPPDSLMDQGTLRGIGARTPLPPPPRTEWQTWPTRPPHNSAAYNRLVIWIVVLAAAAIVGVLLARSI